MVDLAVLCTHEDLESLIVPGGHILEVEGAEGFGLRGVVSARRDLVDTRRIPMVVVDFMLGQEETMKATRIHIHLLYRFILQYILVYLVYLGATSSVTEAVKWSLPDQMMSLG